MVPGGFDGGAERVFVQRLLGKDHGLALGVRGRDLIHSCLLYTSAGASSAIFFLMSTRFSGGEINGA